MMRIISKFWMGVLSFFMIVLASCNALDGVKSDVEGLLDRVSNLEDAVKSLESAYAGGKIVTSVESVDYNGGGYLLTFSDGSSIFLSNGVDGSDGENGAVGVTPMVKIDNDGYWYVSYDDGDTFEPILNNAGNPISAVGKDGKDGTNGADGNDGTDGRDGADGKDGICVRIVVDADGYYTFELYSPDVPDVVIEKITTPYTSNPASVLQSAVQDENTGVITLTMADGSVFKFNLDVTYPSGVVVLTDKIVLQPNAQSFFDFRINPSNSKFVPVIDGDNVNIELDLVGTRASVAESYVTNPKNYKLINVENSVNGDGERKVGQYTATVEDLGVAMPYSESVVLVLTTRDGRGERIQISSSLFEICLEAVPEPELLSLSINGIEAVKTDDAVFYIKLPYGTNLADLHPEFVTNGAAVTLKGRNEAVETVDFSNPVDFVLTSASGEEKEYKVVVHYSELPIVYITTPSPITSKDNWTEACEIEIWNAGAENAVYKDVQMKGRGNSTWSFEKKPYAIKLDKKAEVLGMPKHKRWVLLANYLDRTCLRNDVAFEIARRLPGLEWTPRGQFVEVIMNGVMVGNYYLCEQIKVDKNRVDITEITPSDISGEAVTGGYIFELDTYYDEQFKFRTQYRNLPIQFKDPDEDIADEQFSYVQNYFDRIETILYGGNKDGEDVFDYIDIDSFIDWWLVHELARNAEPFHPKSSYMHKDRNGKLKAGPVWDFDYATFTPYDNTFVNKSVIWYTPLFNNPVFVNRVKERWNSYKGVLAQIESYIVEQAKYVKESVEADQSMWQAPIQETINKDTTLSFDEAVARICQSYNSRMEKLDNAIEAL